MSRFAVSATVLLMTIGAIDGVASAATVYSQAGTQACAPSCWTSHYGAGSGFRAYDDFTLSSTAAITTVNWQGIYIDTSSATAPTPDTTTWTVGFFADSGNFPGASLYSTSVAAADVTTTAIGSGTFGGPVTLYSFTFALPTAFTAAAGTKYWFSPVSLAPSFTPFFSWSAADSTYDGLTTQTDTSGGTYNRSDDRAFSLAAAAVPEPASWAMMIGGFGLIGMAGRRNRAISVVS